MFFAVLTTFDDFRRLLTMVVAGAERFSGVGLVLNQGVADRCGNEM